MPKQFPWETPPVQGPPSPSQALLKRVSGLGKTAVNSLETFNNSYIKKGFVKQATSGSIVPISSYRGGLSNRHYENTKGWFRKADPVKTPNIIYKNIGTGKGPSIKNLIKSKPGPSTLATRGAVGLSITKYGSGGGGGEFSK